MFLHFSLNCLLLPGRRGVALKPDIKVETVNKETHSLEEEPVNVSTATRMVKAMYSVSIHGNRASLSQSRVHATPAEQD